MEPLLTFDYLARPVKVIPLTAVALPEITDNGKTYGLRSSKVDLSKHLGHQVSVTGALRPEREEKEAAIRRIEHLTAEERGEFNEQHLILLLKEAFPDDKIERVKRSHIKRRAIHAIRLFITPPHPSL